MLKLYIRRREVGKVVKNLYVLEYILFVWKEKTKYYYYKHEKMK